MPDHLNLLADAAVEFYRSPSPSLSEVHSQSILISKLLEQWNHLQCLESASPKPKTSPLLVALIHLLQSTTSNEAGGSVPFEELPLVMIACVHIDSRRTTASHTTRAFLSHLKMAWRDARSTSVPVEACEIDNDDPLVPFMGRVPPSNIDFKSGRLAHPLNAMLRREFIEIYMIWLDVGSHDGYRLCTSLYEYGNLRQGHSNVPWKQHPLIWQSTLVFGLLEAIMEVKIPESFLLETQGDGRPVVSGRRLSMLVFDWQMRLTFCQIVDDTTYRAWRSRIQRVIEEARVLMDDELSYHYLVRAGFWQVEVDKQVCAMATIIESLGYVAGLFSFATSPSSSQYVHRARSVNQVNLGSAGWCPFTVGAITNSLSVMNYATRIKPFIRKDIREHAGCSGTHCAIHNIDTTNYVAQHATPDCKCEYVTPSLQGVMKLLDGKEIPVIVPERDGSLSVRSASQGPYIAISHVWVDGLGSTTDVGLPRCQIAHIASLTTQLVPDGAFWQDGLCVPSDRPMRKRAIELMAKTYERAAKVVVTDAGIRSFCFTTAPLEENLLRIATSGWMGRIWTLQECLLARELYFEFADGLMRAAELKQLSTSALHPSFVSFNPIVSTLLDALLFVNRGEEPARGRTFPELLRLLHHRTTSKPEDETLAIAGLVNVNAGDLVALPTGEERMMLFLQRVKHVPRHIIYLGGPKLTKPGFRWAPLTLTASMTLSATCDAICTESGIRGDYFMFTFPEMDLPVQYGSKVFIRHPETEQYYEVMAALNTDHEHLRQFNAVIFTNNKLPEKLEAFECAAVFTEQDEMSVDGRRTVACRYVNTHALICHGGDLSVVLPLLRFPHSVVEGKSFKAVVLVT